MRESVRAARRRVAAGFATSYAVGRGLRVINAAYADDRWSVWSDVQSASEELLGFLDPEHVPEVGINLAYALPAAETPDDVCAISGRIVRVGRGAQAVGPPAFGASRHVARIVLAAMAFDPARRAAMNLRYDEGLVDRAREVGLSLGTFDRSQEPAETKTMEWGTREAIRSAETFPDVIYDLGGPEKVAMIRFLADSPAEVVALVRKVMDA